MPRFGSSLVVLLAALAGCGPLDLPRDLMIEGHCGEMESEEIMKAVDVWNDAGRKYLGKEMIVFKGFYLDRNGFRVDTDISDDLNVFYCINDPVLYEELRNPENEVTGGICYDSDIVIFPFKLVDGRTKEIVPKFVREVSIHEIGHWLGFPHSDDRDSIMYRSHRADKTKGGLAPSDIETLCILYDCI